MPKTSSIAITILALSLTACGGSSSSGNNGFSPTALTPVPTINSSEPTIFSPETSFRVNQVTGLFLLNADNSQSIIWRQTAGQTLNLLSTNTKAIAFTPTVGGNYSFEAVLQLSNGTTETLTYSLDVNGNASGINGYLGHAVIEGNKVSLRAHLTNTSQQSSIRWRQIQGPTVNFTDNDTNGDLAIFFNAPLVTEDTLLVFEVSASNGTDKDIVSVLVENSLAIANNAYFDSPVAKTFPYKSDSPYANSLVGCVYSNQLTNSCKLSALPLIAQDSATPDIETIMNHVVVSHQWMGDRFKEFLTNEDINDDFKNLLRATTAIVVSYDIRPSFYWAATGAIYLDPNNLWLTAEERDTINEAPDFRANFGNSLQFAMPARYVKNDNFASLFIPSTVRSNRQPADRLYRLSSLLYHELAHANDFIPSFQWPNLNSNLSALETAREHQPQSELLHQTLPLFSEQMRSLAQVSFRGETATETQQSYQPLDIASLFSPDRANDYYNYSSHAEDFAMLFEELMMQTRYQVLRDVAVTNKPVGDNVTARDYIITWGQRGRVGETSIQPRVEFATQKVLPELNINQAINNLVTPQQLDVGDDWIESLTIGLRSTSSIEQKLTQQQELPPIITSPYYHKAIPNQ